VAPQEGAKGPTPLRKRWWFWVAAVLAFLFVAAAIGGGEPEPPEPPIAPLQPADPVNPLAEPEPTEPEPVADSGDPVQPAEEPAAEGEIWEWALGRNIWTDPDLAAYGRNLGRTWDLEAHVQSQGFSLNPDSSGVIVSVTLYNDETALGLPVSSSSFSAYQGMLPGGLDWSMTADDLDLLDGEQQGGGIAGLYYQFAMETSDGYLLTVEIATAHADELPDAPMHSIEVRRQ